MRFRLLGSGVLRPIQHRYLTSVYMQYDNNRYLFDTPENTQVLLQRFGETFNLDGIFLTGIGPGETLGLPGLLTTLDHLSDPTANLRDVDIYAPRNAGAEKRLNKLISLSHIDPTVHFVTPNQTIIKGDDHSVLTFETDPDHGGTTIGYRVQEAERRGRFDRERAEELGIEPGPKYGRLHDGEPVDLEDGRTIQPDEVVGDSRPGRSIVYTGASGLFDNIPEQMCDADVAIIDGGSINEHSDRFRQKHMTGYDAGTLAGAAGTSLVVLTHIRNVLNKSTKPLVEEIKDAFDGPYIIGEDGVGGRVKIQESTETSTDRLRDVLSELEGHSRIKDF